MRERKHRRESTLKVGAALLTGMQVTLERENDGRGAQDFLLLSFPVFSRTTAAVAGREATA